MHFHFARVGSVDRQHIVEQARELPYRLVNPPEPFLQRHDLSAPNWP